MITIERIFESIKLIDIQHIEKVSTPKQKGESRGKILFAKSDKKTKL